MWTKIKILFSKFFAKKELTIESKIIQTTYARMIANEAINKFSRQHPYKSFSVEEVCKSVPNVRKSVVIEVAKEKGFYVIGGKFYKS